MRWSLNHSYTDPFQWRPWFAWRPVRIPNSDHHKNGIISFWKTNWVWLEWIEIYGSGTIYWYRIPKKEQP